MNRKNHFFVIQYANLAGTFALISARSQVFYNDCMEEYFHRSLNFRRKNRFLPGIFPWCT